MSNDDAKQDVCQVTDFKFHACRKYRIFKESENDCSNNARNRIATSSHLGVTFAAVDTNQLKCFQTKTLLNYHITRENMNQEVTDLPVKPVKLFNVEMINDMGINSDGTLLGILHTRNNDVSVDVFDIRTICSSSSSDFFKPISSTRVGTEQTNQGSCLEWNPAFPDMFAASSTDRSLMVVKINPQNSSSQTLVGIGKFGAFTTAISWSPKGKQLTIGDSTGKIVQLKPELEVVRSQQGPNNNQLYGKVTGLCWLATTEWLVSFEKGNDHDAYLMRCKKDKPTEWIKFHELSYSSSRWPLPPQLFSAIQLLVDWNIVIVGNSKTSEIATVGKRADWQTWVPEEGGGIYLPTTDRGKDTVPLGIAVDRSMTDEVLLAFDGSKKHCSSPLVLCLTNDGVLTAHHVISNYAAHNSCQIISQNICINGLTTQESDVPPSKPLAIFQPATQKGTTIAKSNPPEIGETLSKPVTSQAAPALSSHFGVSSAAPTASAPIISANKSIFGGTPARPAPSALASSVTQQNTVSQLPKTPIEAASPLVPASELVTPEKVKEKNGEEELAAKKAALMERILKVRSSLPIGRENLMKTCLASGNVKTAINDCERLLKCTLNDSKEVFDELRTLMTTMRKMAERMNRVVKEIHYRLNAKIELVSDVEDAEEKSKKLRKMSEMERLMKFNKLETAADLLNKKYCECNEFIKKLRFDLTERDAERRTSLAKPFRNDIEFLRPGSETEIALKVMRNISRIITDAREKIQRTELDFAQLKRVMNRGVEKKQHSNFSQSYGISTVEGDAPQRKMLSDEDIVKARQAFVNGLKNRGPVQTIDVNVETYTRPCIRVTRPNYIDTTTLSEAIFKLSNTPRQTVPLSTILCESLGSPPNKADAATQAEEPPVVKTVVVTVESPAKPISTPPITSTPLLKTKTTATESSNSNIFTSTVTAPKAAAPVSEKKEETAKVQKPSTTPSSIFSGSVFGSKSTSSATPTASLFESPLAINPQETVKKEVKTEVRPELSEADKVKTEDREDSKDIVKELSKQTEVAQSENNTIEEQSVAPVTTEQKTTVKGEDKKEGTQSSKTSSFSFNTTTTPNSATNTSSIFGGGSSSNANTFGGSIDGTPKEAPSIFGGSNNIPSTAVPTNTSSIFGGGTTTSNPLTSAKTSNVFEGAAKTTEAATTSSIFAGTDVKSTPTSSANTPNIFGGGAKTAGSPFGSFGQAATQPAVAATTAAPVTFSFNTGASAPASKTGFGSFGASATPAKPSAVFGASVTAPTVPNVDDGMEDDSISWGGSGGLMSGLGSSKPTSGTNPFAPKPSTGAAAGSSWLFGGGNQQQQQKPAFSFNNASGSQQTTQSPTATTSIFGGAPKFGSQPVFGAKPFGSGASQGLAKNASIFGGAASSTPSGSGGGGGGGFAQFATGQKTSSLFGGGAASPAQANSSIFGGGASGAQTQSSSIFGGGASNNANNKSSTFTSWR